jgi:hypothetical protein
MGAKACGKDVDSFHLNAPAIIPATRINVTAQLMIPKRLFLKNDENLGILIYCVIAHHGMVNLLDSVEIVSVAP